MVRLAGKPSRVLRLLAATLASFGLAAAPGLSAQVGHPPNASPYRDAPDGTTLVIGAGYLGGGRGSLGVGPSNGGLVTLRLEHPLGNVFGATLTLGDAHTTRFLIDPTQDSISRNGGLIGNAVFMADLGATMRLTGGKSWHGLVPTIGGSIGVAVGNHISQDTSQYAFNTKVIFGPEATLRWYVSHDVSIRANFRVEWWRLSYPLQFQTPAPDGSRVLGVNASTTEWTQHPCLTLGVGWIF
ncbi:MAG TPA: hypothetical protein VN848_02945 [Gemmatimonadales bacterium]|nr:hypothetical protein [Gemmatimonadales bacterium]